MMKTLAIVFIIYINLIKYLSSMPADDLKAAVVDAINNCKIEMNLTDDILTEIRTYDKNMSRDAKCFQACLVDKFGIMGDDLKIDKDKMLNTAKNFLGYDEKQMAEASKILNKCNYHSEIDRCEAASEFFRCIFESEHALKLKELL